jgi:hypothetical protein
MPSIALIGEGVYDIEGLDPLIRRVNGADLQVYGRPCGGPVRGRYVKRLQEFKYLIQVQRAVVVSDAGARDHDTVRQELESEIKNLEFPFPVHFVVIVRELEALLLADPHAIESVCSQLGSEIGYLP